MKPIEPIKYITKSRMLLCALCLVCSQVSASNDEFFLDEIEQFGIGHNDFNQMQILPTHMLDNDQLFRAAQAERDTSMSMSQRIINNRWLLDSDRAHSSSPSTALRRYLRMQFLNSERLQQKADALQGDLYVSLQREREESQFSDMSNYDLRVSDDRVRIRFNYTFD